MSEILDYIFEIFDATFRVSALSSGSHVVAFNIPKAYGYVIFVAVITIFLLIWQSMQVL